MAKLSSSAEKQADKARTLHGFKDFSLGGVKDQVESILKMIGKVEGIFSTYSLHDISHIDSMLAMLDWLIPPSTQEKMTSVDWLLTVLAIYLHDLGMVVTAQEFDNRMDNKLFTDFLDSLNKSTEAKDYLARTAKMTNAERERFFYQELVRDQHAARIRLWITGKHRYQWGNDLDPISNQIAELLSKLPKRFRDNLGDVCESHHRDNLDDRVVFPLCQSYGSAPTPMANVQYSAIVLRTADLLHITDDRTPSVMYRTLRITDPIGADEWKKQMGTYSVRTKHKAFDEENEETHVILVSADFDEERPFFVLSEYLEYANDQICLSRRWAAASQKDADAADYSFPWLKIDTDIRVEGNEPVPLRFELDRGRLLELLVGHTIYNDPTVAVRELLQNAIDAVRYQHALEKKMATLKTTTEPPIGDVAVKWDSENRYLVVEDNGMGMDRDTIENHLMKVGASYYDTPKFREEHADFVPISRFGIGILTCFMVSDRIEIVTCQEDGGHRIRMSSVQAKYLLKKLEPGDELLKGLEPHGTRVTLELRQSIDVLERTVEDIVRHWVILPACEVTFQEDNSNPTPIGHKSLSDAIRHLYKDDLAKLDTGSWDVILLNRKHVDESYDLACLVNRTYTPERDFKISNVKTAPAVCIEGIRVDSRLPGYRERDTRICAILSVRNNRKFRTTVSRATLEQDDEYIRVGKICTQLLFEHLASEVKRIAALKGRPLSQASTAGQWIYRTVTQQYPHTVIREYIKEMYCKLPLIVIETVEDSSSALAAKRELISKMHLSELECFWTIESRLVDYLGIISRDLGSELGLNDFLAKLAPTMRNPAITPLVCDADDFRGWIPACHYVTDVQFSRRHQQAILKWEKCADPPVQINVNDDVYRYINAECYPKVSNYLGFGVLSPENRLFTCSIQGDMKQVETVRTRVAVVSSPDSAYATYYSCLRQAVVQHPPTDLHDPHIELLAALLFLEATSRIHGHFKEQDINLDWERRTPRLNEALSSLGIDITFSAKLRDILGSDTIWFDPSDYWLSWRN